MSDNFEFDDDDDLLLNAFCTPPNVNTCSEKRLNGENDENVQVKKPKLNESTSPVIQFSHKCNKNIIGKSPPSKNTSRPNAAKRIFPGPAGILLDENRTDICSQDSSSFLQDGPWEEMSKDFKISNGYLYDKFNIAWIKKEATANKFVDQKAPFLAGILLSLEVSEGHTQKSINITLKDVTGTIQGTILQNLYEEYASHFTLGSALVLIQFGVLSCTCDKCDNHHLTITPKNLGAIYNGKEKIVIKEIDPENILKDYYQRNKELEALRIINNSLKNISSSTPLLNSPNRNKCAYSNSNASTKFKSPYTNGSILSPNPLNKITDCPEIIVPKNNRSETFLLPKVRAISNNVLETTVVKDTPTEIQNSSNFTHPNTNQSPPTTKKLFTFKKVNTPPVPNISYELNCSQLSSCSTITLSDSPLDNQNTALNFKQDNFKNTNQDIKYKSGNNLKLKENQLSVKVDKEEHEKIWKDLLEDIDVNSLFDENF